MNASISSTPDAAMDLTKIYGQFLVATCIATALWGMQCMQIYIYHKTYTSDASSIKALIVVLWLFDTIHEVLCIQSLWTILIPNYGDITHLNTMVPAFLMQTMITGLVAAIVHCFFTWRIWIFSGRKWIVPAILLPPTFAQMAGFSVFAIKGLIRKSSSYLSRPETVKLVWSSSIVLVIIDCLIAVMMCLLLWKRRTNLAFSDRVLVRLMNASMSTGICTAAFALAVALSTGIWPYDLYCALGEVPLCALYCNAVLANLNSRKYIKSPSIAMENFSATGQRSSRTIAYAVGSETKLL